MIEFINVNKKYASGQEALSRVTFKLLKNEMAFLTGHSGAGKSTLLKLIMLLESVTRGHVIVHGKHLDKLLQRQIPYFRRSIGVIFQDPQLLPTRTVYENVALPMIIAGFNAKEMGRNVRAALDVVGLLDKEKRYPAALSAGEKQRVSIARAVVNRPPILLADEPTGNLDPELALEVIQFFVRLNQLGTTILIASHDLALIKTLNYRVLSLNHGILSNDG